MSCIHLALSTIIEKGAPPHFESYLKELALSKGDLTITCAVLLQLGSHWKQAFITSAIAFNGSSGLLDFPTHKNPRVKSLLHGASGGPPVGGAGGGPIGGLSCPSCPFGGFGGGGPSDGVFGGVGSFWGSPALLSLESSPEVASFPGVSPGGVGKE